MCFSSFLFLSKKKSVLYLLLRGMEHVPQDGCCVYHGNMRHDEKAGTIRAGQLYQTDGACCFVHANPCIDKRHAIFQCDGSQCVRWIPLFSKIRHAGEEFEHIYELAKKPLCVLNWAKNRAMLIISYIRLKFKFASNFFSVFYHFFDWPICSMFVLNVCVRLSSHTLCYAFSSFTSTYFVSLELVVFPLFWTNFGCVPWYSWDYLSPLKFRIPLIFASRGAKIGGSDI